MPNPEIYPGRVACYASHCMHAKARSSKKIWIGLCAGCALLFACFVYEQSSSSPIEIVREHRENGSGRQSLLSHDSNREFSSKFFGLRRKEVASGFRDKPGLKSEGSTAERKLKSFCEQITIPHSQIYEWAQSGLLNAPHYSSPLNGESSVATKTLADAMLARTGDEAILRLESRPHLADWRWHTLLGLYLAGYMEGTAADRSAITHENYEAALAHFLSAQQMNRDNGFAAPYLAAVRHKLGVDRQTTLTEFRYQLRYAKRIEGPFRDVFSDIFRRTLSNETLFVMGYRYLEIAPLANYAILIEQFDIALRGDRELAEHVFEIAKDWRDRNQGIAEQGFPEPCFLGVELGIANALIRKVWTAAEFPGAAPVQYSYESYKNTIKRSHRLLPMEMERFFGTIDEDPSSVSCDRTLLQSAHSDLDRMRARLEVFNRDHHMR